MVHLLPDASEGEVSAAVKEMRLFIERGSRSVLLLDPDEEQRSRLGALLASHEVSVVSVGTVDAAVATLAGQRFDCVVLHAGRSDSTGLELLSRPPFESGLAGAPVLVYSEGAFDAGLQELRERWVILHANTLGHLLLQASLFLHRPIASFTEPERQMMRRAQESDPQLTGRKVLVVDDDVRNIFALTTQLEQHGMEVAYAESAMEGISILGRKSDVDVVLMDVMMPEMDGYEAMQTIRSTARFKDLPIVALTAKAMKGDREKCLAAGASDYIAKPVDLETLLSLLRVWLWTPYRQRTAVEGRPVSVSLGG
jgi:CheY-like chemotaxis protein